MKKLFVIILFVMLVNVFIVMFNATNIFPMTLDAGQNYSNINSDGEPIDADSVLYDVSGADFGSINFTTRSYTPVAGTAEPLTPPLAAPTLANLEAAPISAPAGPPIAAPAKAPPAIAKALGAS